jgi:ABC-2 type transport system ATP-binding protein
MSTAQHSPSVLPAVQATGLGKAFGDNRAVDGIDLDVTPGEVYGVLGPNGAGKTTMLRMLATLLPIDEGAASVFGVDVRRHPHVVRQLIGVTGQYASVDENLTGMENLRLFARLQGFGPRRATASAEALLERFGLTDAADRSIAQFSGGMRRRLDLAASLITRPPLLFLDEPTTGLDPRTRGQMWDTIRDLVADGCTVLLTTQYLDEADQLAGRICVIDRGRKVAEGTPDELKAQVGTSTLQLRLAEPRQSAAAAEVVRRTLGTGPSLAPEVGGLSVPLVDANHAGDILIALREQGLSIAAASVEKPTLDEVFLALTGHHVEAEATEDHPGGAPGRSRPDPEPGGSPIPQTTPSRR